MKKRHSIACRLFVKKRLSIACRLFVKKRLSIACRLFVKKRLSIACRHFRETQRALLTRSSVFLSFLSSSLQAASAETVNGRFASSAAAAALGIKLSSLPQWHSSSVFFFTDLVASSFQQWIVGTNMNYYTTAAGRPPGLWRSQNVTSDLRVVNTANTKLYYEVLYWYCCV